MWDDGLYTVRCSSSVCRLRAEWRKRSVCRVFLPERTHISQGFCNQPTQFRYPCGAPSAYPPENHSSRKLFPRLQLTWLPQEAFKTPNDILAAFPLAKRVIEGANGAPAASATTQSPILTSPGKETAAAKPMISAGRMTKLISNTYKTSCQF